MPAQRRPAWPIVAALVALGQHRYPKSGEPFTEADLARWVPTFPKYSYARLAIDRLVLRKEVERLPDSTILSACSRPIHSWRLTSTGAQTARAAYIADLALNPAAHRGQAAEPVDPLAARLWSLLRIRRALTADEAATLLVDAGEDVAPVRSQISAFLLAWSRHFPEAIQISTKRVDGFKRYVLLAELGSTPPAIRVKKAKKA